MLLVYKVHTDLTIAICHTNYVFSFRVLDGLVDANLHTRESYN